MQGKRHITLGDIIFHKWLRVPYVLHVRAIHRTPKSRITVLFIHGLGSTGDMWKQVIETLPHDVNSMAVDLLGFGKSPSPYWESYDAASQARSLLRTYLKQRPRGPVILVGHSLGALVAVEFAKRYPLLTKSLILCSPPIYRNDEKLLSFTPEKILRRFYAILLQKPKFLIRLYSLRLAAKFDPALDVSEDNIEMFAQSARASILNQTTIKDIPKLPMPIRLVHGIFDPLVVRSNLVRLTKAKPSITLTTVRATHAVNKAYGATIVALIKEQMTA